jgi:hypothetical protein
VPALDLSSLAGLDNPLGLLAGKLLALEAGDERGRLMVQRARRELTRVADERTWAKLEPPELDESRVRALLIDSGRRALEELLTQVRETRR